MYSAADSVGQALYRLSCYQVKKLAGCWKKAHLTTDPSTCLWGYWIFKIQSMKLSFTGNLKVKCLIFLMIWKFSWMFLGRRKRKIRGRHEGEEGNSRSQNSHGNNCSYYYVLPKVTKTKARKICTTLHLWTSSFFILFFFFFFRWKRMNAEQEKKQTKTVKYFARESNLINWYVNSQVPWELHAEAKKV